MSSWKRRKQTQKYPSKPAASHIAMCTTQMVQLPGTSVDGGSLSSKAEGLYKRQWCLQSHNLHSDHRGYIMAGTLIVQWLASKSDAAITRAIILHEPAGKSGIWDHLPWLDRSRTQPTTANTSMDLLPWPCWSEREWTQRQAPLTSQLVHSLSGQRCFEAWAFSSTRTD